MGFVWKSRISQNGFFYQDNNDVIYSTMNFWGMRNHPFLPAFPDNIHQLNTTEWNSHPLRDPTALESSSSRQISEPKVAIFLDYFHHQPFINHHFHEVDQSSFMYGWMARMPWSWQSGGITSATPLKPFFVLSLDPLVGAVLSAIFTGSLSVL